MNYSIRKEIQSSISLRRIAVYLTLCLYPLVYFIIQQKAYWLVDSLDAFTFMLDGLVSVVFVLGATFVYTGHFAEEVRNRFIIYERMRMPLKNLVRIKFWAGFLLTFLAFFLFVFGYFLFAFYLLPRLGWTQFHPEAVATKWIGRVAEESYTRHTFTQLLEYGNLTYGLIYSCWIALNAAVYASLGFLLLLVLGNSFLALSIPFLLYMIGSFMTGANGMHEYQFAFSVFPFSYGQQPIWMPVVPFLFLLLVCVSLKLYINKRIDRLDNVL